MKKEEDDRIKWIVSAEVFQPEGEKEAAEKKEGGEGVRQMKLYPWGPLPELCQHGPEQ